MVQVLRASAINRRGKKTRIRNLQYGPTDREDEVSAEDIYYISIVCLTSSGTIPIHEKRLQISEAGRKQKEFEIVFKSLACFSTQFRVKESSKP